MWTSPRRTNVDEMKLTQMKKKEKTTVTLVPSRSKACRLIDGKSVTMAECGPESTTLQGDNSTSRNLRWTSRFTASPTSGSLMRDVAPPTLSTCASGMNGGFPMPTGSSTTHGLEPQPSWWTSTTCPTAMSQRHHFTLNMEMKILLKKNPLPLQGQQPQLALPLREGPGPTSSTPNTMSHELQDQPPGEQQEAPALMPATPHSVLEPEPFEEPAVVPSITQSHLPVPLEQQRLYQAPTGESFAAQRNRFERQESLLFKKPESYGPARSHADRETPYSNRPLGDDAKETVEFVCDVDMVDKGMTLPPGWTIEEVRDEWIIEGNYLTRKHYLARDQEFTPTVDNCPIDLKYLTKQRYTKLKSGRLVRDKWTRTTPCLQLRGADWTGYTRFKIHTTWRKQAVQDFYNKSNGAETIYMQHEPLSEQTMSLADRLEFLKAKEKELSHLSLRMTSGFSTR